MAIHLTSLYKYYTQETPIKHFFRGVNRVLFNSWTSSQHKFVIENEAEAQYQDWKAVGDDLRKAIKTYESEK